MLALRVAFNLPPSAYATMLIRELLKCETSALAHATRNAAPASGAAPAPVPAAAAAAAVPVTADEAAPVVASETMQQ
jgi:hypothetical protein